MLYFNMDKESKFLIDICRAYLDEDKITVPENIDYKVLYKSAKNHNLLAVCHCALTNAVNKDIIPEAFLNTIRERFFDLIYIYECQSNALTEITEILNENKIRHILFKGAVIRQLYPVPESRAMGDIDILIEKRNRAAVRSLLEAAGYKCTADNGPVFNYKKNNVLVEVHTKIISDLGDNVFDSPFENAEFDNFTGKLEDNYCLAYLIAHTAHHFRFYGAGIRHIIDLAVIQKNYNINLDTVINILKEYNLDTFAKVILSVCFKWFKTGKMFTQNTQKTEEYLCSCGVFGSLVENKGAIVTRKEMEKGRKSTFRIKFHLLFPSYKQMKNIPYIKFIDGRPWLTPYAWCYRFVYNIKHKKNFMKSTVSQISDDKSKLLAEKELEFFEEIGLL